MLSALIAAACLATAPSYAAPATEADALYAEIKKLRAAGKSYEATKSLWPAAETFPGHLPIQAAYQDDVIPASSGNYETLLEQYRSRYETESTPENAYLLARIDYDRVRAHEIVDRALRSGSKLPGLLWLKTLHRAEDLAASGKHESALALIEASTEGLALDAMGVRKARISLLMGLGRLEEASGLAEPRNSDERHDPGLHSLRTSLAYIRGDWSQFVSMVHLTPGATGFAYGLMSRAAYLDATGRATQAREFRNQALAAPRDAYDWDEVRMHALSSAGDREGSAQQAVALLKLDPGNSWAQALLASYALSNGNIPEGEKMARAALAKNPRSAPALELMASIEFSHGRYRDAILLYNRAIDLAPGVSRLWIARGAAFSHMGDRDRQWKSLTRARKLNPEDPYLLSELGRLHMNAGEFGLALQAFQSLIAHEEPGIEKYRGYGRCSVGANRLEQGLAAFERARELAETPEQKKAVKEDISWANGFLREATERYPRDAAARVEKVKVLSYLEDAPAAAYLERHRIVVGRPWGAPVIRWETEGAVSRLHRWAPSGAGLYALVDNRIDYIDLKSGATHTILAEVPMQTAFSDELPRARHIVSFSPSPNGKHMLVLANETKRGKTQAAVILDYTSEDKKPKEIYRRDAIGFMQADPVTGRLLIAGGGNLRMNLAAGTTEEFPTVGCTTADMDYSPGGERMACVAVDAKGPETSEIILYDLAARRKVPLEIAGQGASWSPDGQRIAYVWRGRQLRVLELKTAKVTAYDVGHERGYLLPFQSEGGTRTRWSPDGRFIQFQLAPAKSKPRLQWHRLIGEPTTVIVDRRNKTAWTRAGTLDEFEWAPAPKP